MGILSWIGIGFGIAVLANWKMPEKRDGLIILVASAIAGAISGGIVYANHSTESPASANVFASLICATGGALLALFCVQLLKSILYIEP